MVKSNVDLFDDKGLYFSMQTTFEGAAEIMEKNKQKVILITFVSRNMDTELLEMAAIVAKRAYKVCWLIVVEYQFRNTVNVLKASNISINADIVAAIDLSTPPSVKVRRRFKNQRDPPGITYRHLPASRWNRVARKCWSASGTVVHYINI
ncbi:unnamed protein product [Acanthoscelides obtectus]|uniref:Uncharacterized protein n=1 Tax=Acanthoscelides obtectus TaxID=200917 RepID=A0A9P0JUZ4_ACAOB|nr:unnamed protein product [Acanthoscelides obtectus]CAK1625914.1 hypothetical protein AOBTE_LOCUS3467 [Acanthoscelides obtectus]